MISWTRVASSASPERRKRPEALSETLWEELHEELADPRARRVAEVSEQLGEIVAILASLARADARAPEDKARRAGSLTCRCSWRLAHRT